MISPDNYWDFLLSLKTTLKAFRKHIRGYTNIEELND